MREAKQYLRALRSYRFSFLEGGGWKEKGGSLSGGWKKKGEARVVVGRKTEEAQGLGILLPRRMETAARKDREHRERNGPARTRHPNIHIACKAALVPLQVKARPLGKG